MKTRLKIVAVSVLVLGAVLFLMLTSGGGYKRAVEVYKQELRARGEKLTIAELVPPTVSNYSNVTRFMNSTSFASGSWPFNLPNRMQMVAPGRAQVGFTNITSDLMQDYQRNVRATAELREILNAGFLKFNLDYSQGYGVLLPHLARLKQAEQVACGTAMQALYAREFSEAWLDLIAAADLVRLYEDEPIMISGLVRVADARIALGATWEALEANQWTESQLSELQAKWEVMNLFKKSEAALAMERAFIIDVIAAGREARDGKELATKGLIVPAAPAPAGTGGGVANYAWRALKEFYDRYPRFWVWKSSWSYVEEHFELQSISAALAATRQAQATGAVVPALRELNQQISNIARLHATGTNHFYLSTPGSTSVYDSYPRKLASMETARRLLVTAIALRRYQLQHGVFPTDLKDLVPAYLPQVPTDFMDGKPLRYRLNPDGTFLLYSVGLDSQDNSGDATPVGTGSAADFLNGRDIVWPRAATAKEIEDFERRSPRTNNATGK